MSIIPSDQRIHTVSADVDTTNRKSQLLNSNVESVTMADITQTVIASAPSGAVQTYIGYYSSTNPGPWFVEEIYNDTGITFTWSRDANGILIGQGDVKIFDTVNGYYAQVTTDNNYVVVTGATTGVLLDAAKIENVAGGDAIKLSSVTIDPTGTVTDNAGYENVVILRRTFNDNPPIQQGT